MATAAPQNVVGFLDGAFCGRVALGAAPAQTQERCVLRGGRANVHTRRRPRLRMAADSDVDGESMDAMRARLEGLFGGSDTAEEARSGKFDGSELRRVLKERFTVEYDVQPVVRNDRVYIHVLWRYFEQVSFYMKEEQWAEHTEAVADLLKKWDAVDYFCDYIASIKKRPVVGISLNVPIPGVVRGSPLFPSSGAFDD